jgi:phage shock protein PspC (stress-responsive transcriptional regulator)
MWGLGCGFDCCAERSVGMPTTELTRSKDDRMIAGVCGGLAKWLGWDSTAVRIIYVLASILSAAFPGTIVYIILAIVMPLEDEGGQHGGV